MNDNNLTITAYSGSTPVVNTGLEDAEGLTFTTIYPGGVFGSCAFYCPRLVDDGWTLQLKHRLVIRNGMKTVWEGRVTATSISIQGDTQGRSVTAFGYWSDVLMQRTKYKPWADTAVTEQAWPEASTAYSGDDDTLLQNMYVDRLNRIRFTPKAVAWPLNGYHRVVYTAPTGQTVKRVTYNYDMQEAGQVWALQLYDNAGNLLSGITASGTGAVDVTLGTPNQIVFLAFRSGAAQTPASDGTIYAQVSSVVVYTETGAIDMTEICKDVRAMAAELSANETLIGSNTLSLVPFVSEGDTLADILINAAAYGDSGFNAWAAGVRESNLASDSLPILFAEQYPVLTDYDYAIRVDEANFRGRFEAEQDIETVKNWISVAYTRDDGRRMVITPDDDANLKDTTSITAYGERHEPLSINTTSSTTATNYGRRYLAARKDPQWRVSSGISVVGSIRGKGGPDVPASEIRAGKRVRIENFLSNLNGSGLTLLITGTSYDDDSEVCRISVGQPDTLDVWLAQMAAG